jgi:protoheme ferro-lyase
MNKQWEHLLEATNPATEFSSCRCYYKHHIFIKLFANRIMNDEISFKHATELDGIIQIKMTLTIKFKQN